MTEILDLLERRGSVFGARKPRERKPTKRVLTKQSETNKQKKCKVTSNPKKV